MRSLASRLMNVYISLIKKNAYALKTPRVVALPFIYGVDYIIISNQYGKKGRITVTTVAPIVPKNMVSLVHHGAYCALMVHIAPSWCTSTPYTVVVVYNVP